MKPSNILFVLFLFVNSFATAKYVDLSLVSDSANNDPPHYWHTGNSNDPFNHRNFKDWVGNDGIGSYYDGSWHNSLNHKTDTFYIKGMMDASITGVLNNPFIAPDTLQVFLPWEASVNGPYRITNWGGSASIKGTWKGGFIRKNTNFGFGLNAIWCYNMIFETSGAFVISTGFHFWACSFHADGGSVYLNDNTATFVDCIINFYNIESCGSNFRLNVKNCVIRQSKTWWGACGTAVTDTNCQFSWSNYKSVAWNAPKDSFNSQLLLVGVNSPPRPGDTPYVGYEVDLWGNDRYDIGPNWQKAPVVVWTSKTIDTFGKAVTHTATILSGPIDSAKVIGTALPSGLSMTKSTGVVSGTPTTVSFRNVYTFRAWGVGDSCTSTCTLSVIPCGPMRHYVDLSQLTDTVTSDSVRYKHTGNSNDPFNFRLFREMITQPDSTTGHYYDYGWHEAFTDEDTFFIKGTINSDTLKAYNNPGLYASKDGQVFLPWNPSVNGPYRMKLGGNYNGIWKGGYIWGPGNLWGKFYTMYFGGVYQAGAGMTSIHTLANSEFYGSTINCNEIWYHVFGESPGSYFQDCILRNPETSGPAEPDWQILRAKNTAFSMTELAMRGQRTLVDTGTTAQSDSLSCQMGAGTNPYNCEINTPKDSFYIGYTLNNISTPPQPGNSPYTGYETDLWGNPRFTIGANYQASSITITAQPQDAAVVVHHAIYFTVEATGTDIIYQWQIKHVGGSWFNDTIYSGNSNELSIMTNGSEDKDSVRCILSNIVGIDTSEAAFLGVMKGTYYLTGTYDSLFIGTFYNITLLSSITVRKIKLDSGSCDVIEIGGRDQINSTTCNFPFDTIGWGGNPAILPVDNIVYPENCRKKIMNRVFTLGKMNKGFQF